MKSSIQRRILRQRGGRRSGQTWLMVHEGIFRTMKDAIRHERSIGHYERLCCLWLGLQPMLAVAVDNVKLDVALQSRRFCPLKIHHRVMMFIQNFNHGLVSALSVARTETDRDDLQKSIWWRCTSVQLQEHARDDRERGGGCRSWPIWCWTLH